MLGIFLIKEIKYKNRYLGPYEGLVSVENVQVKEYGIRVVLKTPFGRYVATLKDDISIGDELYVMGTFEEAQAPRIPGLFDYHSYLKAKGINGVFNLTTIKNKTSQRSIRYLDSYLGNYYDKYFSKNSADLLKALLLGQSSEIDEELKHNINTIGISHLFVVSGLHVTIFVMLLNKLLRFLHVKEKYHDFVILSVLFGYLAITKFMISVIRVFSCEVLKRLNQRVKLGFSSLDQLSISIIFVLLLNPFYASQLSFILTYLIATTLVISNQLLYPLRDKKIRSNIILCLLSLFVSLPVVASINPDINFFSFLFNLFFIPFVTIFLIPFSIVVSFLPFLSFLYEISVEVFIFFTSIFGKITIGMVRFPTLKPFMIYVYYGALWYFFQSFEKSNRFFSLLKSSSLFLLVLVLWHEQSWFFLKDEIVFFDLPVGEATLIRQSFNRANILIDTGENINNDILIYLKKEGIRRIDYLIISHGDSDHIGKAKEIIEQFRVKCLILSKFDQSSLSKKLITSFPNLTCYFVQKGDAFSINQIYFQVIHPERPYPDINNNSIVFFVKAFGKSLLFTGDIEKKGEFDLIKANEKMAVDVLKVAHHGSITSTSLEFLHHLNYNLAIIMNGSSNYHGFPNPLIRARLKNVYVIGETKTLILEKWFWEVRLANINEVN